MLEAKTKPKAKPHHYLAGLNNPIDLLGIVI